MVGLLEEQMWAGLNESLRDESAALAPVQLRRVLTRITDGPFGSNLKSEHYIATGARVVRLGNIGKAEFKNEDQAFVSLEHFEGLRRHAVAPGDLLIAGLGDRANHVGRACVAPALGPAMVKADCYCAGVDRSHALPEFVALWLSSPSGEAAVAGASRGSTRTRINVDVAKATLIPLVPLERQRMIVTTWERERQRLRVMTSKISRQVALLKERRQALITAAVTGELDVTTGAA
jgi:type I restriction enzyme S subunit